MLMSIFGGKVAVVYVVLGLIVAVVGGTIIEKLHMEESVVEFIRTAPRIDIDAPNLTRKDTLTLCKIAGGNDIQKSISIYFSGSRYWCSDP